MSTARVVERPIASAEVEALVAAPGAGAVVTFTGAVRDQTRGRRVVRLEYEAYVPMAEKVAAAIAAEAVARWPGARVAVLHRIGRLEIGEASVVIAVAAPHRGDAFDACRFVIDQLKRDVPIWKRELFEDGAEWVGLGP